MKDFTELYGFEFGAQKKEKARPKEPFTFTTPNHSEENVKFHLDLYTMFMGTVVIDILNPDGSLRFNKVINQQDQGHLSMFVTKENVDPLAGKTDHLNPTPAEPRTTWLEPNTTYTCNPYRPSGKNERQPIGLIYGGTDDNEVEYGLESAFKIFDSEGREYELTLKV